MIKKLLLIIIVAISCRSIDQSNGSSFIFISMEKTECMGKCPTYKVEIYNDGKIVFTGHKNVPIVGQANLKLKKSDLSDIIMWAETIDFFNLEDRYMGEVTDLPTVILVYNNSEKEKKVIDYYNAPAKLKEFEEKLENVIFSYLN